MIAFERLAMLVAGDLSPEEAAPVEEHVLSCDACAATAERLVVLTETVRETTRDGGTPMLVGRALVARLEQDGLVTRRYRVPAGGEVACTVTAEDIYTAMRLEVDARGATRLDIVYQSPRGVIRYEDVPFDGGGIVYVHPSWYLRPLPTAKNRVRIVSVTAEGDHVLGEFVFDHTAFAPK